MVKIYDNFFPAEDFQACAEEAELCKSYGVLHGAGMADTGFKYNWLIFSQDSPVFASKNFERLWQQAKTILPEDSKLSRCYVNAHTFGVEDTIHIDDADLEHGLTVIVYLNLAWYPEWFGQTVFWNTRDRFEANANDITMSVLPKANRVLVFDKNIPHCVAPLSRRFMGVRLTCMFKVETFT